MSQISDKRKHFKQQLKQGRCLRFVGSFSPLVSRLIEERGFEGVYVSGAVLSSDLNLPDLELNTLSEVVDRGGSIAGGSTLPALVDADTGFGGSLLNVARTTAELEMAGFCGLHLEDQKSPKKCGHLDNKELISVKQMQSKITTALKARQDPAFLIAIRTDARGVEGLNASIDRAKAYQDAGAEAIFPEALSDKKELEQFRKAIPLPLIANMTEFGKTTLLSVQELEQLGYNMVLYPVSVWRLALKAVSDGLSELNKTGHQKNLLHKMLTRKKLYELLKYSEYEKALD